VDKLEPITFTPELKGTEGTRGTALDLQESEQFPKGNTPENSENLLQVDAPQNTVPEPLPKPTIKRPCFHTHNDWFQLDGNKCPSGLYWHSWTKPKGEQSPEPIDEWISTPIHTISITSNEQNESFGLILRFVNPNGDWREWAAPMHLLKGSAEELRGELLNMGVRINLGKRNMLGKWMMGSYPKARVIAALRTGWHDDSFVLPQHTIGAENIRFQSEHAAHNDFVTAGSLTEWKKSVSSLCSKNPLLILAVSAAFAGPLLKRAKLQETGGAGIHLVGDSSQGKTTALQIAGSVWGAPRFVRTWRATSNGLEATAAALNDTLLLLDEISECNPQEIGAIVYALANGTGKQRAARNGYARESASWRIITLSSGERTLSTHMAEGGKQVKAGQEARLLDVPATSQTHGLFDTLHGEPDGRSFADTLKQATGRHYGHAGPAFVEALVKDKRDLPELYAKACKIPGLTGCDGLESRAANVFALLGLAGELATEYAITEWDEGEAMQAAQNGFNLWRKFRGQGQTETRQILDAVSEFILRHGDDRFSCIANSDHSSVKDRAGYWKEGNNDEGRIYLFNSPALKEAAAGFDIRRILTALDSSNWIVEHDIGKRSKKFKVAGSSKSLYAIRVIEAGDS
jgi:putative DNA primase/helicase